MDVNKIIDSLKLISLNCVYLTEMRVKGAERGWIAQDVNDAPPQLKYEQPA
ncbi:hypothetical protein [Acidianus infernus]|uniref:hypothetical protein n=1 Tax=Acidianus infernus TaxID=12915 RepID=UPI0012DCE191|nr:hypothetical protein [Acidianus infernus]